MIASKNPNDPSACQALRCGRPAAVIEDRRRRPTWTVPDLNFEGFSRLWDPTVIDRLQSPITRYHD